jgi:hypothetical protein
MAIAACGVNGTAGVMLGNWSTEAKGINGAASLFQNAPQSTRNLSKRLPRLEAPLPSGVACWFGLRRPRRPDRPREEGEHDEECSDQGTYAAHHELLFREILGGGPCWPPLVSPP